ncbi:rhomboid family intramembrane serine protease [Bacillus tuaregi]|uniref:rhomboid family intramembrane serine protease n=1 Tax=Bacillus tuaregi TaxID=1816695 RepID=UPI0008F92250|nr:rhomboid family intramembrane serine protease [Bacillus tuaregi]
MSFREDFIFWRLANYFISEHDYRIIQLSKSQKELWLEKLENKELQVIRILHYNLDWGNWLQRDIQLTLANGESIRKQLHKRSLDVLNIYITPYPPVDDYEDYINKPLVHPKGEKTKITSLICDRQTDIKPIEQTLNESIPILWKEEYLEHDIEVEKQAALSAARKKVLSEKALFENGKPRFTYLFIAIQIIMFLLMEAAGGSTNSSVLIQFGAKANWLILEGDWWRLFTPIFLHIGILHLLMNTLALYYLGLTVERLFGNSRFLFIYLFAGISGSLASLLFSQNISAGASGAIFGCFGALLYFGTAFPKLFFRTMGTNILIVIAINLAFGFTISGIDNAGHIGGLIGGFLAAAMVHLPKQKRPAVQIITFLASAAVLFGLFQYTQENEGKLIDEQSALVLAQQYVEDEDYQPAYRLLQEYDSQNESTANILFLLSFVEIKLNHLDDAKAHLHQAIDMEANFHEAFYNLSLLYLSEENYLQAKEYAEEAHQLQPENKDYDKLLTKINELESAGVES